MNLKETVGLPNRPFLYTLDQLSTLINISEQTLKNDHLYFDRRSVGAKPRDRMMARNIAPDGEKPDWRVAEKELVRWLRYKGFRVGERTFTSS